MVYFKNRRKELGYTIIQLAKKTNISPRRLSAFEKETGDLGIKEVTELCNVLNMTLLFINNEMTIGQFLIEK